MGIANVYRTALLVVVVSALAACAPAALAAAGDISTVAGTTVGFSGDGGPATAAQLDAPAAVAPTADGGFLIADADNNRIRRVSPTGTITTVAGTATSGFSGDGGPATAAQLSDPFGVATTSDGGFLISDTGNGVVRKVLPNGRIETVAGVPDQFGLSGDGGPATAARLYSPYGVTVTADGGFLIADTSNHRIRRVFANGTIVTVAGAGTVGLSGDGGAATSALLNFPIGVAETADGRFLIGDSGNDRVRQVSPSGIITTLAGTAKGLAGDGGPATAAALNDPYGVAVTPSGGVLIAEYANDRVRAISGPAAGGGMTTPVTPGTPTGPRPGPAFGARTNVFLSLTHARITAGARLGITVANANAFALSGSLTGHSRDRFTVTGDERGRHARKPIPLATERFAVAAHGHSRVALPLSRRLRSRLAHARKLAVVLTARVTDPAGQVRRVSATVTVNLRHASKQRR